MSKIILLLGILVLVQAGLALKCKNRGADDNKETEETCPAPAAQQDVHCLTQIFTDTQTKTEHTVKKCAFTEKGKKYDCVNRPNTTPVKCDTCDTDLCNNAAGLQLSFLAIFGILCAYFAPKLVF